MFGKNKNAIDEQVTPAPENNNDGVNLPLFFRKPQVISTDRHAKAKMRNDITMAFASDTNSIPLTLADINEAAKFYPIVFTQDEPIVPLAIVGLEQKNYFVDAKGQWIEGTYAPSYVRKYPFLFLETPDNDQLTLCIDEPALSKNAEGSSLYEESAPSAFVKNALEFCVAHQEQHRFALEFCKALKEKNMLLPQQSDVTLASGRKVQLNGFQIIDIEKFKQLSQAEVYDWHQRGFLAAAYYVLQSASNWRNLLDLANKQEASKK